MIVIAAAATGAAVGAWTAYARKGSRWDMAQYATGYAIAFGLTAFIAGIVVHRVLV